ncbi:MAG: hypothetical protein HC914_04965 [Chloroflexaceae bacterium]|nr:hypothetical protein [Chloroflexaceae bacterium]
MFSGGSASSPGELIAADEGLFFAADNGTTGIELWHSDGTAEGTVLVRDINTGVAAAD